MSSITTPLTAPIIVKWKKLRPDAQIPKAQTAGAACFDMSAAMDEPIVIKPHQVTLIPTGLAAEIPLGYEMQIRARSGLAAKHGFTLINGIGTIDADYRGEIKAIVTIHTKEPLTIQPGDRICQALVAPVLQVTHEEVSELSSTERGAGGMGSTGVGRV